MSLSNILEMSSSVKLKKTGLQEERLRAAITVGRKYIAYWREYPDMFVDFLVGDNPENFHLYTYQRVFLRAVMRHRYSYATYPRA